MDCRSEDDKDIDVLGWIIWLALCVVVLSLVIAGLSAKGEGAEATKLPPPLAAAVQLRFFPLEGTGLTCIAAVTTQDAAPGILGLPTRPTVQSFQWIECHDTLAMKIRPTPSPIPTTKEQG